MINWASGIFRIMCCTAYGLLLCTACQKDQVKAAKGDDPDKITSLDTTDYQSSWTLASHGKADPDYRQVFAQDQVRRIDLTMTASQWNTIRTNMRQLFGYDFGERSNSRAGFPENETDYIDVTLSFEGKVWSHVGFRLKGNSSLAQAWGAGIYKLPFKLNFDKFENTYPAIEDQHFYGFEELSFSPGFKDQSLIREKVSADIFRMAGIAAAQTAFYQVYVNFGSGSHYCGVYTAVEIPEDEMIKQQFGEKKGNIYKPESNLKTFIAAEFEKKNHEAEADYGDVRAFIQALNHNLRITNAALWRQELETVFYVDHYLRYLAVNNTIVNWDSYGTMAHNYYLYNHPTHHLTWIPWDHNEALSGNPGITGTPNGGGMGGMNRNGVSLSMNEVNSNWPLIRYIADDPIYRERYKEHLKEFIDKVFTIANMNALFEKNHHLIKPYAEAEQKNYTYLNSVSSFTAALAELKAHVDKRRSLVSYYVP